MRIHWQLVTLLVLFSCSEEEPYGVDGGYVDPPEREVTDNVCPVHQVPVFKEAASGVIACHAWDPKCGLTAEQIRNRFPYAIWDSNLHRMDETEGAKFPRYNLVCDRCEDSWGDYVAANPFPRTHRFQISITGSQDILINDTEFSLEQIPAVVAMASSLQAEATLHLRIAKSTPPDLIKVVVAACEKGGITEVIFGSDVPNGKTRQMQIEPKSD